jgi:hypothetical protein
LIDDVRRNYTVILLPANEKGWTVLGMTPMIGSFEATAMSELTHMVPDPGNEMQITVHEERPCLTVDTTKNQKGVRMYDVAKARNMAIDGASLQMMGIVVLMMLLLMIATLVGMRLVD